MDEYESWLPDLTTISLRELMTTTDPVILAAMDRVIQQLLDQDPDEDRRYGCR